MVATDGSMAYKRAMPDNICYDSVVDGVLQVSPEIEQEISEVEHGDVISLNEFKTIFAKWID